jgi:hypothetical protein
MMDTPLEDPAQAWNALTIGGYTAKDSLTPPTALSAVVGANDVSPYSRTSVELPIDLTPIKPEVLFEAGNMAVDDTHLCSWHPELSLLSTGPDLESEPLVPFWATSAATGVAGEFFGKLQAALPGLWPETYRALAVQSADWPQPIRKLLIGRGMSWKTGAKGLKQKIVRRVGFGVPDIDRAIMSAKNDVTLVAQQELQPFTLNDEGAGAVYNEMHF